MDPNTTAAVRDIFVMVAAGVFSILGLVIIFLIYKLYRPFSEAVINTAKATENLNRVAGDLSAVSKETAENAAQTAQNAVVITENVKAGTSELPSVIHSVGQAARGVASASNSAARIGRLVGRLAPESPEAQSPSASASASSGSGALPVFSGGCWVTGSEAVHLVRSRTPEFSCFAIWS